MPKTPKQVSSSPTQEPIRDRGRYYDALQQGHSVCIREEDGTTTIQYYQLDEGTVMLDPDVREYFPDAKSVNAALRSLIALIPPRQSNRRRAGAEPRASKKNAHLQEVPLRCVPELPAQIHRP